MAITSTSPGSSSSRRGRLPVEQGREAARFEQPRQRSFDALRLLAGLTTPRAQPTQVVDRSGAVVLQTDDPRQLNQCRPELQHWPFVEVRSHDPARDP